MIFRTISRFVVSVVVLSGPLVAQSVPAPSLAVHTIWGSRELASDLVELSWMKDGKSYTTVEEDASGNTDLYRVDAVTGAKQLLVRGADLVPAGGRHAVAIEEYHLSGDESKLLVFTNSVRVWRQNTKGTFYVWDLVARRLPPGGVRARQQHLRDRPRDRRRDGAHRRRWRGRDQRHLRLGVRGGA